MNLVPGSLEGSKGQPPSLLQEQGFWWNVQKPLFYWAKQSLMAHHKLLCIDLNRVVKNEVLTASVLTSVDQLIFFYCLQNRQINSF